MSLMTLFISLCSSPLRGSLDTKKPQVRFTYLLLTMPGGMKGSSEGLFWASLRMVPLQVWFIGVFISLLPFVVGCPSVCLYCACLACYQVFSKARAQLLLLFEPVLRYTIRCYFVSGRCVSTRKHFRASQVSFNKARAMVSQC